MNPEIKNTTEQQNREKMIVNEQTLASMINVPFENFTRTLKHGDPNNPEIAKINDEAKDEFEKFLAELSQETQIEEEPKASPENLIRIMDTVKRAIERRKATAAQAIAESTKNILPGSPEAASKAAEQMAAWEDRAARVARRKQKHL